MVHSKDIHFPPFEGHVLLDLKGTHGCPIRRIYLGGPFEELQVMHTSDACGPFKRTHTFVQNECYTKGPFEGHSLWKQILLSKERIWSKVGLMKSKRKGEIFKDACWPESYVLPSPSLLHWPQRFKTVAQQFCYVAPIFAPI